jgi:hypothetical protein
MAGWWLVILLLLTTRPSKEVNAFSLSKQPLRSAELLQPPKLTTCLFMISQKDKRRGQEEQKNLAAFQEQEEEKERRLLVGKLQELQAKRKHKHGAAQKLLKNAAHDGLLDIGWEARQLAIDIFYKANRPSDVAMVLSSIHDDVSKGPSSSSLTVKKERQIHKFGLWAYSMLRDWDGASKYANHLYHGPSEENNEVSKNEEQNPLSSPDEQNQLRQWAIQAFTKTGQNLELSKELWKPETDGSRITNSFLQCYLRQGQFQEANALWEESDHLDQESYRALFKSGAKSGDIPLMTRAIDFLAPVVTPSDWLLLLQTLVATTEPMSAKDQDLVVATLQAIVEAGDEATTKKTLEPEFLSQVFLALEDPSDRNSVFQVCQTYYDFSSSWVLSLRPAAKARILPFLWKESSVSIFNMGMGEDALKILESIVNIANPQKSRAFLRAQSPEFGSTALLICRRFWEKRDLSRYCQVIVEECWKSMTTDIRYAGVLLEAIPRMYDTKELNKTDVFAKVSAKMSEQLVKQVTFKSSTSSPSPSPSSQPPRQEIESKTMRSDTEDSLQNASFSDPKVNFIVDNNARLIRAIVAADSANHTKMLQESAEIDYQYIAQKSSEAAMIMVAFSKEEFVTLDVVFERRGRSSDSQAREAIQTIMRELIQSNLLSDDELVQPAMMYYWCLAHISLSWSAKDCEDLLFPVLPVHEDPFLTFRHCVMGDRREKSSNGLFGNLFSSFVDKIFDSDKDLAALLPSILEMASQCDARTGSTSHYNNFVNTYRTMLIQDIGIFMSLPHLTKFCDALDIGIIKAIDLDIDIGEIKFSQTSNFFFQRLWNDELTKAMIADLATCKHARYWIENRPGKVDLEFEIQCGTYYLMTMYAVAGFFSDEKEISDSYLQACNSNCRHIMVYLLRKYTTRIHKFKPRSSHRGKASNWYQYFCHWKTLTRQILEYISNSVIVEGTDEFVYEEYSTMEDGQSSWIILVEDVLSQLRHHIPEEVQKDLMRKTFGEIDLHPNLEETVKVWMDRNLRNEVE